jgi:hypothetical protein
VLRFSAIPVYAETDDGFGLDQRCRRRICARTRHYASPHPARLPDCAIMKSPGGTACVLENGAWAWAPGSCGRASARGDAGIHSSGVVITAGEGGRDHRTAVYERASAFTITAASLDQHPLSGRSRRLVNRRGRRQQTEKQASPHRSSPSSRLPHETTGAVA